MTPETHRRLDQEARRILAANDRGGYTVPNERVYPFQWNWDSAFVAMGFAMFDEDRAWRELETLFLGQWADGMVPSIVFHTPADHYYPGPTAWGTRHQPPTTGISQPPVAATSARFLWERAVDRSLVRDRLAALFPKLMAWHRWWHETRDPDGSGLVTVTHPWESGRDNSPDWDAPLAAVAPTVSVGALRKDNKAVDPSERPTDDFYDRVMTLVEEAKALGWDGIAVSRGLSMRVCDLGVQCILSRADRDLLALAEELGRSEDAATLARWIARSDAAAARLRAPDGTYRSLDLRTGELAPCPTSASFLPLYARFATPDDVEAMSSLARSWWDRLPYGVASCDPGFPGFDPLRYWRGPVWLVVNRMIADGFAAHGLDDIAARIADDSAAMLATNGFREYFDPRTAMGLGGHGFSWSAAMWLSWLSQPGSTRLTGA
ncbi:hypothetical protein NK718_11350 [Alsobacter sp. SYSU M60028]|uniref:Mannosylglycerate hydrolase MGH1-like glycoside hydrolase domain-containing protein n=1 Tax=Alsobacter ponti TaxID=2962936 RepID=A0ABT1LCF1_9HYPH|nr:hypothetical protein [Alsobacter ponti]MCP8939114.1 hypothetical protein [Alsobacter ponti]